MAEIKTCEEYVLSELSDRERKIESLEKELEHINKKLKATQRAYTESLNSKDIYIHDCDRLLELLGNCLCVRRDQGGYTFYLKGDIESDTVELIAYQFTKHGYPLLTSIED